MSADRPHLIGNEVGGDGNAATGWQQAELHQQNREDSRSHRGRERWVGWEVPRPADPTILLGRDLCRNA